MIALGTYNLLKPLRNTSVGVFLADEEGTEILLPNKYVPREFDFEQSIEVFCYLDHEERPVATTLTPKITRDSFASLKVAETNKFGAFLDWGLEKQLFVPFKEQLVKMEEGKTYTVYCFLDEKSFRIMASSKLDKFLGNDTKNLKEGQKVELIIWRRSQLGWEVIIDQSIKGLLYFDTVFKEIGHGDLAEGYVKKIREDGKIDVSLEPLGIKMLEPTAQLILKYLEAHGGTMNLHDKSSPEDIKNTLGISKKAFKKGLGLLYKARKVQLESDGVILK